MATAESAGGITYLFKADHRDGSALKSQWSITQAEELAAFDLADSEAWLTNSEGWGVHIADGRAQYLGVSAGGSIKLFVARFRGQTAPPLWHGYPGDPSRRSSDIPLESVLNTWQSNGWIRKRTMRLLLKGAPCSL